MEIKISVDFDFDVLKRKKTKVFADISKKILPNAVNQLKENITEGNHAPIKSVTKSVRKIRGRVGINPLIDTGNLVKSIQKTKSGVKFNEYGWFQDKGFTLPQNYNKKGLDSFYAPNPKSRTRVLYKVGGSTIPPRPWIYYKPTEEDLNIVFKGLVEALSVPKKVIKTIKV